MIPTADLPDLKLVAAGYRAELAQSYVTGEAVQTLLGIDAVTLTTWRRDTRLLSVWHSPANSYLYPAHTDHLDHPDQIVLIREPPSDQA